MKKNLLSASEIVDKIKGKLSKLRFNYSTSGTTVITITIKNSDRFDALEQVKEFLDLQSEFKYKFLSYGAPGYRTNVSTFGYISIDKKNFISENRITEIRVVFKYKDGSDKKIMAEWNSLLITHVFPDHPKLKRSTQYEGEMIVMNQINKKIDEIGKGQPITIRIKGKEYNNVAGLVGGKGFSKADFVIVNMDGEEIGFLSHKKGDDAKSFQQYSGISKIAGLDIHNHKEVRKFHTTLSTILEKTENQSGDDFSKILSSLSGNQKTYDSVYQPIKDPELKKKAIFGKHSGNVKRGMDNVDFFVQGEPKFESKPDLTQGKYKGQKVLVIKFSAKTVPNHSLRTIDNEQYTPVIGARKDLGRVISGVKDEDVKSVRGARGGIWTNDYMRSRKSVNLKDIDMSEF
jgi:hypothetical protein